MTKIEFDAGVLDDYDRIVVHLQLHGIPDVDSRIEDIVRAIDVLKHNPLIGRPVNSIARELIIGRDAKGYVVLYTYAMEIDSVFVLAIRSQRESGYAGPD